MANDIRALFESVGLPDFPYHEIGRTERRAAVAAKWLSQAGAGSVRFPFSPVLAAPGSTDPSRPWTIAIVSLQAQAGRTTIAANLAASLAQENHRATAVDLDPSNGLARWFSIDAELPSVTVLGDPARVHELFEASRFRAGAVCLPFGACSREELNRLEDLVEGDAHWFPSRQRALGAEDCEFAVIDTASAGTPWLKQALRTADEIVVVLTSEERTYSTLVETETYLNANGYAGRAAFLVNRFDGRRPIDRETITAMRAILGERVLPFVVQSDVALTEGKLVLDHAPDSQATADIGLLAEWIVRRHEQATRASPA